MLAASSLLGWARATKPCASTTIPRFPHHRQLATRRPDYTEVSEGLARVFEKIGEGREDLFSNVRADGHVAVTVVFARSRLTSEKHEALRHFRMIRSPR